METFATPHAPPDRLTYRVDDVDYDYELVGGVETTEQDSEQDVLERFDEIAANNPELRNFEAEAVEPNVPYEFPEPPESISDADRQIGAILNWRLNEAGCHLDSVRDDIGDENKAREWLLLKIEVSAGMKTGFSMDKWDGVIEFEKRADAFLKRVSGGTVYADA